MPQASNQNRTPLLFPALLIPGLIFALLQVACSKSRTRTPAASESDLIGKWTAVEMSFGGIGGLTKGILEARTEFFADPETTLHHPTSGSKMASSPSSPDPYALTP